MLRSQTGVVTQDALPLKVEHKQTSCMLLSVGNSMLKRERIKGKREWGGLHGRKTHRGVCLRLRKLFYFQNLLDVIRAREIVLHNAQISAASCGFVAT
jgi:hypothetical protein